MKVVFGFVFVLLLVAALAIPSVVLSKEYQVELNWTHSGTGHTQFVFVHAVTESGPWEGPVRNLHSVNISDLVPNEVDGKKYWKTTITIDVEDDNKPVWWVCYAKTSYDTISDISHPVKSKFVLPSPKRFQNVIDLFEHTKVVVNFI